uniref:NADH dehydrogenase [ubiquinone] 1 alpha subcomplex subunit 11 n=1 Tax=Haplochromis burtoni TaxID=8153 RepID=A0A3Q3CM39_HAPBU
MGYWDLPEGTDCVEKTWIATKLGTALVSHTVPKRGTTRLKTLDSSCKDEGSSQKLCSLLCFSLCLSELSFQFTVAPQVSKFILQHAGDTLITHSAITGTSACLGLGTLAFFTKVGKMEGWKLAGPPKL